MNKKFAMPLMEVHNFNGQNILTSSTAAPVDSAIEEVKSKISASMSAEINFKDITFTL